MIVNNHQVKLIPFLKTSVTRLVCLCDLCLSNANLLLVLVVFCVLVTLGCDQNPPPASDSVEEAVGESNNQTLSVDAGLVTSSPLADFEDGSALTSQSLFEQIDPKSAGIDFEHIWNPPPERDELITSQMAGGGVCIGDYDQDGRPDVFLTRPQGGSRLYRNLGGMRFEDVTSTAGVDGNGAWCLGPTFVDIDNDGDLDLYVCVYRGPNLLYVNQGDGTFKEQAKSHGLDFTGASIMLAFADYDRDGDLDGYLLTNRIEPAKDTKAFYEFDSDGRPAVPERFREYHDIIVRSDGAIQEIGAGQFDHLYVNNGDGTFTDASEAAGIRGNHYGLSATWWDYNSDGWPDLYVANDFWGPDHLYRNNHDGTFTDVAPDVLPHTPWFSMGSDVGDLNNDGLLDFMASDMAGSSHFKSKLMMGEMNESGWFLEHGFPRQYMRNAVYLNSGMSRFMEVAHLTGLAATDWTWAVKLADLDNDGRVDVYVTNGMTRAWFNSDMRAQWGDRWDSDAKRKWFDSPKQAEANFAFRNLGDLVFQDSSKQWGLDEVGVSFGAAMGDLDGDGDLDLIVNNFESAPSLYRNRSRTGGRLVFRLRGTTSNRYGIGATVRVETSGLQHVRYHTLSRGFMSADNPEVHFGLGEDQRITRVIVNWPSGIRQELDDVSVNHIHVVTEPNQPVTSNRRTPPAPTMFKNIALADHVRHKERPFDDFRRQPLLPFKLSQLGPGMAWGDVDQDGDDDLYLGGARGESGRLFLRDGEQLVWRPLPALQDDATCEDMGAIFFDVDSDGDLDLYVVSGGVETAPDQPMLRDRLYTNDGSGWFKRANSDRTPDTRDSGSTVAAADFDGDGDLDLFVGGRTIPGQYPLAPSSRLLRNDAGQLVDITRMQAPDLERAGMVCAALWSDADNDGDPDLLLATEWGPIRLYRNEDGRLQEATEEAGFARHTGWWNGITGRDLDADGDIDYVATNLGLNTKYHASGPHPALLFYGNMDGTGQLRLVEAEYEGNTLYPLRGRSCSTHAMPSLGERFPTFEKFALAPLADIYTPAGLKNAKRLAATTLESAAWINDGKGRFTRRPLPRLCQISPSFGVLLTELDGDGQADLCLAQNSFSPQRETGRMDGGLGLVLKGLGGGRFKALWPNSSGIVVAGDAKALTWTDLNNDGRADLLFGVNDDRVSAFTSTSNTTGRVIQISLRGGKGNPTAIGARITLRVNGLPSQTAEVYAGEGYLSQSPPRLMFGLGDGTGNATAFVRWPSGEATEHVIKPSLNRSSITLTAP